MNHACIDCQKPISHRHKSTKRCRLCFFKWRKEHPEIVSNYKGGIHHRTSGYVAIVCPDHPHATKSRKSVLEHRLVMEKVLGRYLEKHEIVHHINGIKNDNRPENLVVITSQKEHFRLHQIERGSLKCKMEGCDKGGYMTKGFCKKHYARWLKLGRPDEGPTPDLVRTIPRCKICNAEEHQAKGLCTKHYMQYYNNHVRRKSHT